MAFFGSSTSPVNSWLGDMDNRGAAAAGAFASSFSRELDSQLRSSAVVSRIAMSIGGLLTAAIGIASAGVLASTRRGTGILNMSQASGMSIGAAGNAYGTLQGFGVSPESVSGLGRNSFIQGMASSAFGINAAPGSPEYLRAYREKYQNSSQFMRESMESTLGLEGLRSTAMLPDDLFNKQMQRSGSMQQGFGLKPQDLARSAQEMTLFNASFKQFIDLGLSKIGMTLLPYLTGKMDEATTWVSQNADKISASIVSGVEWSIAAANRFGKFLYAELPSHFLESTRAIVSGIGWLAESVESGLGLIKQPITSIFNVIGRIATGTYNTINGLFSQIAQNPIYKAIAGALGGGTSGANNNPNGMSLGAAGVGVGASLAVAGAYGASQSAATGAGGGLLSRFGQWLTSPNMSGLIPRASPLVQATRGLAGLIGLPVNTMATGAATLAGASGTAIAGVTGLGVAAGTLAGRGLYGIGQSLGLIDPTQGFGDRMQTGFGRFRDLITGNWGNYDKVVQSGAQQRTRQQVASSAQSSQAIASMGGLNVGANGNAIWKDFDANQLFGGAQRGAGSIADWSERTAKSIPTWDIAAKSREFDAAFALKEIAKNTGEMVKEQKGLPQTLSNEMKSTAARMEEYRNQDRASNLMRIGA